MCINIKISLARLPQWFVCLYASQELFAKVEKALNDRPRKRHGYQSPQEKHQQLTTEEKVALVS